MPGEPDVLSLLGVQHPAGPRVVGPQALVHHDGAHPFEEELVPVDHRPAQDDELGVEQVRHVAELRSQRLGCLGKDVARKAIPVVRRRDHVLDADILPSPPQCLRTSLFTPWRRPPQQAARMDCWEQTVSRQPGVPAEAEHPPVHRMHVAELAGIEALALVQLPVDHDPHPDAFADPDAQEVINAHAPAAVLFPQGTGVRVIDEKAGQGVALLHQAPQGNVVPVARVQVLVGDARRRVHGSAQADPDPQDAPLVPAGPGQQRVDQPEDPRQELLARNALPRGGRVLCRIRCPRHPARTRAPPLPPGR